MCAAMSHMGASKLLRSDYCGQKCVTWIAKGSLGHQESTCIREIFLCAQVEHIDISFVDAYTAI